MAYQVVGDGPIDLVMVPVGFSHIDMQWDDCVGAHLLGS